MRTLALLFAFTLSCLAQPLSPHDPAFLQSTSPLLKGLVCYWPFDEYSGTRFDRTTLANHLSPTNAPGFQTAKVRCGTLFTLTSNQCFATQTAFNWGTPTKICTVAFWLKCTFRSDDGILMQLSTNMDNFDGAFYIDPNGSDGKYQVWIQDGTTGTPKYLGVNCTRPSTGDWHHYMIVIDNQTTTGAIAIYIDGSPVAVSAITSAKNQSSYFPSEPMVVGSINGSSLFATGILDELAIWNRGLTNTDAAQLYESGTGNTFPRFHNSGFHNTALRTNSISSTVISDGLYNAFPGLAVLPNGHLICNYFHGTSHTDIAGDMYYTVSGDGGQTWNAPTLIAGTTGTGGGGLIALSSGTLAAAWASNGINTNMNYWTGIASGDAVTWTDNGFIPSPYDDHFMTASSILVLTNGDFLLSTYGKNVADANFSVAMMRSTDTGATWLFDSTALAGTVSLSYTEAQPVQMANGRVYMVVRQDAPVARYVYVTSDDNGSTWSLPVIMFSANVGYPSVLRTRADGILMFTRYGVGAENIFGTSWDQGQTYETTQLTGKGMYQALLGLPGGLIPAVYAMEISASESKIVYLEFMDRQ